MTPEKLNFSANRAAEPGPAITGKILPDHPPASNYSITKISIAK
jgi:hypothetical protein